MSLVPPSVLYERPSPEHVLRLGSQEGLRLLLWRCPGEPADQSRGRGLRCLTHDHDGAGCHRVSKPGDGDFKRASVEIGFAAPIDQGRQAGDPKGDPDGAEAPGSPKTIRHDDAK